MESPIYYLWYIATFGYVLQCKKSYPWMLVLFSPLIIPGCLFKAMLACLVVLKAVSVLSGWGVNLLMFVVPLMLQLSGHLVVGVALVCICFFIYKAILQIYCSFDFEPRTPTAMLTYIIWLIYEECYIILHICGLVAYTMLYYVLSYLPCMLVLMPWYCQNVIKQVVAIAILAYERWCCFRYDFSRQVFCSKTIETVLMHPEEEREDLGKTSEVKEETEKKELTDKTTVEPRPETSHKTTREKEIENIRRSILTTNLTKENVKDMWLKKQQSKRGRRRWARMSNNALSVSVSPMSKEW